MQEQRLASREDEALSTKLVVVSAFRILVITLSLGASYAIWEGRGLQVAWQYGLIAATYAASIIYTLALRHRLASVSVLAYLQIPLDSIFASLLIFLTGGVDSIFAFVYVFVVIGAAMTLFRNGALLATSSCLLLFAAMLLVQGTGAVEFLHPAEFGRAALSFVMYGIGLGLVGYLSSTLAETVRQTGRELASTESALEELEELHASILKSLPAGLMTVENDGTIRYVNHAALQILGYRADEVIDRSLNELVPAIAGTWRQRRLESEPSTRARYEGSFARSNGTTARIGYSFAPLSSRRPGTIVVFQDVTEIVRLKESVERSERLATIGKFAAGLAHEVRNPLSSICASLEVLNQTLNPPESIERLMSNVMKESERLDALITDFLNFARHRELDLATTDVSALVSSVVEVFTAEAEQRGLKVETEIEPGLLSDVDEDRLRQVLWNLARNAREAMESRPGGTIQFATREQDGQVEIAIRDEGSGISKEALAHIFDPFFTTKAAGSGLGLAIAYSIMEAHGGRLSVDESVGQGTRMVIRLPISEALAEAMKPLTATDEALELTPSQLDALTLAGKP